MTSDIESDRSGVSLSDSDCDKTYNPQEEDKKPRQRDFSSEDEAYKAMEMMAKKFQLSCAPRPNTSTAGACDDSVEEPQPSTSTAGTCGESVEEPHTDTTTAGKYFHTGL